MTRDEKERIARLEAHVANLGTAIVDVAKDVKEIRDAMLRGEGAAARSKKMSDRVWAAIALLGSLLGGTFGAAMMKRFG